MMIDMHELEDAAAELADDPAVKRAERRLRILEELTEIGMEMVRALRPGIDEVVGSTPASELPEHRDPVDYARLSRSIRLSLTLEAKTDEELSRLKSGLPAARALERAAAFPIERAAVERRKTHRRHQVSECLRIVAETEAETPEQFDDLCQAMNQRLDLDVAYEDFESRPLREVVERLCHDLCLHPDWSGWTDHGWALARPRTRARFSVFNQPSPRPIQIPPRAAIEAAAPDRFHDLE